MWIRQITGKYTARFWAVRNLRLVQAAMRSSWHSSPTRVWNSPKLIDIFQMLLDGMCKAFRNELHYVRLEYRKRGILSSLNTTARVFKFILNNVLLSLGETYMPLIKIYKYRYNFIPSHQFVTSYIKNERILKKSYRLSILSSLLHPIQIVNVKLQFCSENR
jgi:hypothetical protein